MASGPFFSLAPPAISVFPSSRRPRSVRVRIRGGPSAPLRSASLSRALPRNVFSVRMRRAPRGPSRSRVASAFVLDPPVRASASSLRLCFVFASARLRRPRPRLARRARGFATDHWRRKAFPCLTLRGLGDIEEAGSWVLARAPGFDAASRAGRSARCHGDAAAPGVGIRSCGMRRRRKRSRQ